MLGEKFISLKNRDYLWKQPYITVSQQFKYGIGLKYFLKSKNLSPLIGDSLKIDSLFWHQEKGIENILNEINTIVASGTGSGKTEIFLIPILDYCIRHQHEKGVKSIIVYPMNSLAMDQVERLRKILYPINEFLDKKVSFAIYTGNTPESMRDLKNLESIPESCPLTEEKIVQLKCPSHCDKKQFFRSGLEGKSVLLCHGNPNNSNIKVDYQLLTREEIRENPPDILITNYVQLEYLLLRDKDFKLFSSQNTKYIVFDEVHSYSGARGIDVSLLIRRLRGRLKMHGNFEPICIGTSATISTKVEKEGRKSEIAEFASKLFGVEFKSVDVIEGEVIEFKFPDHIQLDRLTEVKIPADFENITKEDFQNICKIIGGSKSYEAANIHERKLLLGKLLLSNPFFQELIKILREPHDLEGVIDLLYCNENLKKILDEFNENKQRLKEIIWTYLKIGSLSTNPDFSGEDEIPLIRVNVHNFYKTIENLYQCLRCGVLYSSPRDRCEKCDGTVEELGVCRFCGKEFLITKILKDDFKGLLSEKQKSNILATIEKNIDQIRLQKQSYSSEGFNVFNIWQCIDNPLKEDKQIIRKKCLSCGAILLHEDNNCIFCKSSELKDIFIISELKSKKGVIKKETQPHYCPFCNNSYGKFSALSPVAMSSNTASTALFNTVYDSLPINYKKLLIFTDNRQAASYLAGFLEDDHLNHSIRNLLNKLLTDEFAGSAKYEKLKGEALYVLGGWYGNEFEAYGLRELDLERKIDNELASTTGRQRSIESLGLIEINYDDLENETKFNRAFDNFVIKESCPLDMKSNEVREDFRKYLITILNLMRTDGALSSLSRRFFWERDDAKGYLLIEGNKKINSPDGIKLKNFLGEKAKIFLFTQKLFGSNKEDIKKILRFSFAFLKEYNLIVDKELKKYKDKDAKGYVVNSNKIIIKTPVDIYLCKRCKRAYTNIPRNVCSSWRCNGTIVNVDYIQFLIENKNYYFHLYKDHDPIRMVTKEDTGALDAKSRHEIELEFKSDEFKKRKVDVIIATPTLELGVSIGDLLSVGLFKAPPSPASYLQRTGRAGRKEKISFNNTFLFLTPIDMFYFRYPQELIKGHVRTPSLNLGNKGILERHINSIILEEMFVHSPNATKYPNLIYDFIQSNFLDMLKSDLYNRKNQIKNKIIYATKDLNLKDSEIDEFLNKFATTIENSINRFNKDLERLNHKLKIYKETPKADEKAERKQRWKKKETIYNELDKLKYERNILQHFMDTNVIPRYAFPGVYVDLVEQYDKEEFGQRSKNIALNEYVPGIEVYLKKQIYKSIGVDFKFIKPDSSEFYVCNECNTYLSKDDFNYCILCKEKTKTKRYECISPEVIFLKNTNKPINLPRDYQETVSDIFIGFPKITDIKPTKNLDGFILTKYGNIEITQIVSGINIEEEGISEEKHIELCNRCGKVKEKLSDTKHFELGGKNPCQGKFENFNLYYTMPTNVMSIKVISGQQLFGLDVNVDEKFLTTLKNAIINAAQILVQAEDGEIEGVVKDGELILYDNIDGGVGYVDEIYDKFEEILYLAGEKFVLNPQDNCEKGCLKCLYSYRRKRDIEKIDKRDIVPLFKEIITKYNRNSLEKKGELKKNFSDCIGKNIRTIYSPPYDLSGVIELKNILKTARDEIKITSLYVTDDEINWSDEGRKSWVDILLSIKLNQTKNLKITVIVREPTLKSHKKALKRLLEAGVDIRVFKDEFVEKYPAIVHSKLIVVDPFNVNNRLAIHTSGNFSLEMWKNHDTYDFGNDAEWVSCTYEEISKIERMSKKVCIEDLEVIEGLDIQILKPGQVIEIENIEKMGQEIANAQMTVRILDPYLTRIKDIFEFLSKWLHKDVEIKIITARTDSNALRRVLDDYKKKGYQLNIIRYFDRDKKTGQETILHDRYIIIDNKKVIELGKGLNTFFETKDGHIKGNISIKIFSTPTIVHKFIENFDAFWQYENSNNGIIRNFPKEVY